ncbi:hypothetical protein LTR01_000633 [Friedmanniomyces endolithicus]|nr:hypothetical protein LTR01_000633 [Friedmanniomyces endolithicus]
MPTALSNHTQETRNTILTPLIDAHLNGHLGNDILDFATIFFGTAATEQVVTEGKEERREALPANGALVMMVCRSLMRAYVSLRKQGEEANAEELRAIADRHYSRETVDAEMVEVIMGWKWIGEDENRLAMAFGRSQDMMFNFASGTCVYHLLSLHFPTSGLRDTCKHPAAAAMPSALCELPNELLANIAEHLQFDFSALRSLARTSRSFQAIAEPVLYRSIFFRNGAQLYSLQDALACESWRYRSIHTVDVRWSYQTIAPAKGELDALGDLISAALNIEDLTIESPYCNQNAWRRATAESGWSRTMDKWLRPIVQAAKPDTVRNLPLT